MSRNTSVSLGDHFTSFIDHQVQAGRYGSASDVMRAGLRLLEEHEAKVKALQEALNAGEQSGPAQPFDFEAFKTRKRAGLADKGRPLPLPHWPLATLRASGTIAPKHGGQTKPTATPMKSATPAMPWRQVGGRGDWSTSCRGI